MRIVPIYAALLALLFVVLSVRTLRLRRRLRVAVGDGGDPLMLRAMRAHANFAEYVPLGLLLLAFAELGGMPPLLLHAACIALLGGRFIHAYGLSRVDEDFRFRVAGMSLTFFALISAAAAILAQQLVARVG